MPGVNILVLLRKENRRTASGAFERKEKNILLFYCRQGKHSYLCTPETKETVFRLSKEKQYTSQQTVVTLKLHRRVIFQKGLKSSLNNWIRIANRISALCVLRDTGSYVKKERCDQTTNIKLLALNLFSTMESLILAQDER
jgi:hypothetical protein